MTHDEALAWLRGERSMTNMILQDPFETWLVRIAEADAAAIQQAYWIAKAHAEGLVPDRADGAEVARKAAPCRWQSAGGGYMRAGCSYRWFPGYVAQEKETCPACGGRIVEVTDGD